MFDEIQRLRACPDLAFLLNHYAERATADRTVWQDRLMEMPGLAAAELCRLHGTLIAFDWLEMNIGLTTGKGPGALESCYRITVAGLRALQRSRECRAESPEPEEPSCGAWLTSGSFQCSKGVSRRGL